MGISKVSLRRSFTVCCQFNLTLSTRRLLRRMPQAGASRIRQNSASFSIMVTNRRVFLLCDFIGSRCRVILMCDFIGSRITSNTEVTRNSPHANRFLFHLSNSKFPSLQTLMQARAFLLQACLLVQTDCDYRYALKGFYVYTDTSYVNASRRLIRKNTVPAFEINGQV